MRCRTEPWIEPACPGEQASDPTSHRLRPCVFRSQGGGLACRPKTAGPPDAVAPGGAARSFSSLTRSSSERSCPAPEPRLPDLVGSSFTTTQNADWNDPITASGQITNQGNAHGHDARSTWASTPRRPRRSATGPCCSGEVTIPAGLAPGQSAPFTTTVKLPSSPLPGMNANGVVHINLKVDPQHIVRREQREEQHGRGPRPRRGRASRSPPINPPA